MKLNERISYSAVAAAVAIACGSSFVADAATVSNGGVTVTMSQQGNSLSTSSSNRTFTAIVTLGSNYIQNDTAQLTITGGNWQTAATAPGSVNCVSTAGATTGTFGGLSYDRATGKANYRVTGGNPSTGDACTFAVTVQYASMSTAGAVTLGYAAQTASSGLAFDPGTAATFGSVVDQFASAVPTTGLLDATVDVNRGRYHFDGTAGNVSFVSGVGDRLTFSVGNLSSIDNAAGITSVVAVIRGDFDFLDDDGTAGCSVSDITANRGRVSIAAGTGSLSINSACSELTYTESSGVTSGLRSLDFGKTGAPSATAGTNERIIDAPQSFDGSIAFTYAKSTSGSETDTVTTYGEWTLNGASINVAFMPYSEGTSRILNLTNRSAQTGAVTVSAIDESGVACPDFAAGTSTKGSIINLSAAVDAGIRACYGASFAGRVALTVTANIPASSAELYSGYNRNGSLSTVVNNSNGRE